MKNIILDTDLYNEIDDQIALAYVLKSKDALNLEAVTIAPLPKVNIIPKHLLIKVMKWLRKYLKCAMNKIMR